MTESFHYATTLRDERRSVSLFCSSVLYRDGRMLENLCAEMPESSPMDRKSPRKELNDAGYPL